MSKLQINCYLEPNATMPSYGREDDAGMDLYSRTTFRITPGESVAIDTGVHVNIPKQYVGLVRGRSGMAFKYGIWAFEGTIDAGYTGSIGVLLQNFSKKIYEIKSGDRIAQLMIIPVRSCMLMRRDTPEQLGETIRGQSGFGSSGV